jgi:Holliday junction DNA helicase RuvA
MYYSICGKLEVVEPNLVVVEAGGIGYSIKTTAFTIGKLKQKGSEVKLFTYLYVREDALELFGFNDLSELSCFKMLISVSGVGPKAALSILSDLTPESFAIAIATSDSKMFTKSKGIGAKIAQRIVLELKDKITSEQLSDSILGPDEISNQKGNAAEAIKALVVLGYSSSEARKVISSLDSSLSVEEMIKVGLKSLF